MQQHLLTESIEISPQVSTGLHDQWKILIGDVEASLGIPINSLGVSNFSVIGVADAWAADQHIALGLKAVQANAAGAPSITGTPEVGQSLSVATPAITDANGVLTDVQSFSYQWTADGADIAGATAPDYWPSDDDAGKVIRVKVGFKDVSGFDNGPFTSAPTAAVHQAATLSVPWSAAMTVGTFTDVSNNPGFGWSALLLFGAGSPRTFTIEGITYTVSGVLHVPATRELFAQVVPALPDRFTLHYDAAGRNPSVGAQRTYSRPPSESYLYTWTGVDAPDWAAGEAVDHKVALAISTAVNVDATGTPAVSGTAQVGDVLTADTAGISDQNGKPDNAQGFTYQWQSETGGTWTDITGAVAPSYWPSDADVGKPICVQVSFKDDDGFEEGPLDSAAVAAVTESATYSVPWCTAMTAGTTTQVVIIRFGYSDLSSFGSMADTGFTVEGQNYTVDTVSSDTTGSLTKLALNLTQRMAITFTLLHGQDGNLSSASVNLPSWQAACSVTGGTSPTSAGPWTTRLRWPSESS